jgi:glycosyltransferase involved in cell wall biosynthesis
VALLEVMISVITPSFQQSAWLRLCAASVADQQGVQHEHIVQEAGDGSDFEASVSQFPKLRYYREADSGMYDGINRGLGKARGEICVQLNCDEQLLPGALQQVSEFFSAHPEVDLAFAGTVVVHAGGDYICTRPGIVPWKILTELQHMSTLTCATFFRREFVEKHSLYFDTSFRGVGDSDWLRRVMRLKPHAVKLPFLTSAFFDTGENFALSPAHLAEAATIRNNWPIMMRLAYPALVQAHRLRKFVAGDYSQQPFTYQIYTRENPAERRSFHVPRSTGVWRNRF